MMTRLKIALLLLVCFFGKYVCAQQTELPLEQPYRITEREGQQNLSLGGAWQLFHRDSALADVQTLATAPVYLDIAVPGSIQWALYHGGKLPHPYAHTNSYQYRWIDKQVWYYRKVVNVDAGAANKLAFLSFDGLDYFSRVWVNDTLVGSHAGMFGGPVAEIGRLLHYGADNTIVVELRSGRWGRDALNAEDVPRNEKGEIDRTKINPFNPYANGDVMRPWAFSGGVGTEPFYVMGFWKTARIDFVEQLHLERPYLTTKKVEEGRAELQFAYELFVQDHTLKHRLYPRENHLYNPSISKVVPELAKDVVVKVDFSRNGAVVHRVELKPEIRLGRNLFNETIHVPNPVRWFPNGMGTPELYSVSVSLERTGETIDRIEFPFGIRTIDQVPSAARRTGDRWADWQFVINGQPTFIKGMNWTTLDVLNDHREADYRWALESMRDMGVQLLRVWGGALFETETFYNLCNELGIMVWQDFPLGNRETAKYDPYLWESQVVHNILRLRNHPSLAIWCGGNEFNPYIPGNTVTTGVVERSLAVFDPSRTYFRASPDDGSVHLYPDMDPARAGDEFAEVAWISELGMHSMPDADLLREMVDPGELDDLGRMLEADFHTDHPDFLHHFTEYAPHRAPRMLSRASHMVDVRRPSVDDMTEATQIGAGEWYQIVSEDVQANYPVTTGLMPWVFKRHWPVTAIQLMDWFGQPTAPYYFLKRTYEPLHLSVDLERLLYRSGETVATPMRIVGRHAGDVPETAQVILTVYDDALKQVNQLQAPFHKSGAGSIARIDLPQWRIPADYADRYLFVVGELRDKEGNLLSRAQYNLRVLALMEDAKNYELYTTRSADWPTLSAGPWLKPSVAKTKTQLAVKLLAHERKDDVDRLRVQVSNVGKLPAFMTKLDIEGVKRVFRANDNFFWLAAGQEREIELVVRYREAPGTALRIAATSWNAPKVAIRVPGVN